ncbi:MAG: class I SAM-dependent methyltransferase [Spirulinaceae cyanobacterium RM2_2_10]|nr:class I SAM-dependent methyltransferase [Spirulinaceae cyanobacterium SM2_1_0]NJO19221.1 class I SAM-dependent methyltransferase [Spirulinaceae cyanobacterium RM2_2_10]
MAAQQTLWAQFLQPLIRSLLDEQALQAFYESKDWQTEGDRFRNPDLTYPDYYAGQNFHGITDGYLNPGAAVSYDPITQYVLPPNEDWVRQALIDAIGGQPRRILDLGCGTGSQTLRLKQAFPSAAVTGLDLSPYMLVMADDKAATAGCNITWRHGLAEATGLAANSVDLITIALLFHETPPAIAQAILHECFRLLVPGGQVAIVDGRQAALRSVEWLNRVFEEPHIQAYAAGDLDTWLRNANFQAIRAQEFWWLHQITVAQKPLLAASPAPATASGHWAAAV